VAALRLRKKGGHGGHNGMRSIVTCLSGSQEFARLRIGIGRPQGQRAVSDHVLTTFDKREGQEVEARGRSCACAHAALRLTARGHMQVAVAEASDVVRSVLSDGIDRAMSKHNGGGVAEKPAAAPSNKRPRVQPPPAAGGASTIDT
jgi:PTH1 family peptidyl-tRNA hydrolase